MADHIQYGPNFHHVCFAMALELEGMFFWIIICIEVYGPDHNDSMITHYGIC